MIESFCTYLDMVVWRHLQRQPEHFERTEPRKGRDINLQVRAFRYTVHAKLHVFVALRFVQHKDWFTALCGWSTGKSFPQSRENADDLLALEGTIASSNGDLLSLAPCDVVVLDPTFFGRSENGWLLAHPFAPVGRASALYGLPEMRAKLASDGLEEWRDDETIRSWDLLESYAKELGVSLLNEVDAAYAFGSVPDSVVELLDTAMLPYLRSVVRMKS